MKKCFKCNTTKPLSEFYKHSAMSDGHLNKCKSCTKLDVHNHRKDNIEKIRAYDRERGKNPERIKLAIEHTKSWRAEDSKRMIAHSKVAYAIKKGTIVKQPCVRCNSDKSLAHHENYDKPLDVIWFCQSCHKKRHQEINMLRKKS